MGAAALIEEARGELLFKMTCRHHHVDLFGKNISPVVSGRRSTGPADPLFSQYFRGWNDLSDNIDYLNLQPLNLQPYLGTVVAQVALEVRQWALHAFNTYVFSRGTYSNLLHLIMATLGVQHPRFHFTFKKPEEIDNARFGQRANLYLTMGLLINQLDFLTPAQRREVQTMSLVCAVFYGPLFLKGPLLARASYNDLSSISHYRQLRPLFPEVARVALETWDRHLDYLTPQNIVWSLVNDDFSDHQREGLGQALLALLPQRVNPLPPGPVLPPGGRGGRFCLDDRIWPADGTLPALAQFAGEESFLAFNMLELTDVDLQEWLTSPVSEWSVDPGAQTYKFACHSLTVFSRSISCSVFFILKLSFFLLNLHICCNLLLS